MSMGLCIKSGDGYRRLGQTGNYLPAGTEVLVWHNMEGYIAIKAQVYERENLLTKKTLGSWKRTIETDDLQVAVSTVYVLVSNDANISVILSYKGSEMEYILDEGGAAEPTTSSPRVGEGAAMPVTKDETRMIGVDAVRASSSVSMPEPDRVVVQARRKEAETRAAALRELEAELALLEAELNGKKSEARRIRDEIEDAEVAKRALLEANREAMQMIFEVEKGYKHLDLLRQEHDDVETKLRAMSTTIAEKRAQLDKVYAGDKTMEQELAWIKQKIAGNEQAIVQAKVLLQYSDEELRKQIGTMKDRFKNIEKKAEWALEEINAFNLQLVELERIKPELDRAGVDEKILRLTDLCVEIHMDIKRIRDRVYRQVDERID